jgi:hypothetical protein
MKKIIGLFLIVALISCEKKETRDVVKELKIMEGTWNVDSYTLELFDTTGALLSTTNQTNLGTIDFRMSSSRSKNSNYDFNQSWMSLTALSNMQNFLLGMGAGDVLNNQFYCQYEVDPDTHRLLFWATAPSTSYYYAFDMVLDKKNKKKRSLLKISDSMVETFVITKM